MRKCSLNWKAVGNCCFICQVQSRNCENTGETSRDSVVDRRPSRSVNLWPKESHSRSSRICKWTDMDGWGHSTVGSGSQHPEGGVIQQQAVWAHQSSSVSSSFHLNPPTPPPTPISPHPTPNPYLTPPHPQPPISDPLTMKPCSVR